MKTLSVILVAIFIMTACNNAADNHEDQADTSSSLPSSTTVDTSQLQTDTTKAEKALRK